MSVRLGLLNLLFRLVEKPALLRIKEPAVARRRFEVQARRFFRRVPGSIFRPDALAFSGKTVPGLWVERRDTGSKGVLLFFHGGAFVQGSARTHSRMVAALVRRARVRAFLPDYRLAPEHPFPAAFDDAVIAYRALLEAGFTGPQIALGGDSAGGGLALALLHRICSDELPRPACLIAFSPWTDLTLSGGSLRSNAARDPLLPAERLVEVRDMYVKPDRARDPRASPLFGFAGKAPPVLIQVGSTEILLDDSIRMARRLEETGTDVTLGIWPSVPHVWQLLHGWIPEAGAALDNAAGFLALHLK